MNLTHFTFYRVFPLLFSSQERIVFRKEDDEALSKLNCQPGPEAKATEIKCGLSNGPITGGLFFTNG